MDRESPEDGLFESEKKDENEYVSDGEKVSKKDMLFRKKDKKDKKIYASFLDDSDDEVSPSKAKKSSKTFKFASSKREKSRDKAKEPEVKEKDKKKDKKEKIKETKENKKDKKLKQGVSEEIFELGDIQPVFGVSLGLSLERSRCHDSINLPLVVRDCVDYLQENLANEQIYSESGASKTLKPKLQQLKKLYNNRESKVEDFDVPIACGLLKLFLKDLPEPILTTDLTAAFEEAAAKVQPIDDLKQLVEQLPTVNVTLLSWLIMHLVDVTKHEKTNKMNAQNLAVLLANDLQMSHRLFVAFLLNCDDLFPDTTLIKYVPPITATSPNLPETVDEITKELKKQESLLAQIHAEMNAGFVKREEQLWEVQRIITQLKRKLRSFEKKLDSVQKSLDDTCGDTSIDLSLNTVTAESTTNNTGTKTTPTLDEPPQLPQIHAEGERKEPAHTNNHTNDPKNDTITIAENGLLMLPDSHPDHKLLLRLQLEQYELQSWKTTLQRRIMAERAEMVRLMQIWQTIEAKNNNNETVVEYPPDVESLIAHYQRENAMLDQKKHILANDLFDEHVHLLQLQVDYTLQNLKI